MHPPGQQSRIIRQQGFYLRERAKAAAFNCPEDRQKQSGV